MKASVTLTGTGIVLKNIQDRHIAIADAVAAGLLLAGLELLRQSQLLAPVEFGNLKASGYVRAQGTGLGTAVYVGYTAAYALLVHEKVGMILQGQLRQPSPPHIGRYWDPQGQAQAKFLEAPFRTFKPTAIQIVGGQVKGVL